MLRLVNRESKTIVSAAAVVGALSFASRLVGLVRDRILAGEFGAGEVLDVYYAAFKVPDLLFSLIVVGSLSASFIPIFAKYYHDEKKRQKAWALASNVLHLVVVVMAVVSLLAFIFAGPLAALIAPGFSPEMQAETARFMRIMFLSQVLLSASIVLGSVLQGMKRFALYSLAPILYNLGIIAGAIWLVDWLGPIGLAWGVVFGAFLHMLTQIAGVTLAGYRHSFRFAPRDKDSLTILKLAGPRVLGVAVSQIIFVVFTVIATTLAVGSVTVFQYAYNIQFFPVGIIGVSYAIAAFPSFAERLAKGDTKRFVVLFSSTVRQILFFLIPLTGLFLVLRAQIVRVVVGAGAFDWGATILTADTLAFFTFSFVTQALVYVLARAFFALHDTVTPLLAGLVGALVGIISGLWLSGHFGVTGLGMAFSIASATNLLLLWVPLRQKVGNLDETRIWISFLKLFAAGVVATAVMQLLKEPIVRIISLDTFLGVLAQGLIAGTAGLIVYAAGAALLRSEELHDAISGVRRKFFRKYEPSEPISDESPTAA